MYRTFHRRPHFALLLAFFVPLALAPLAATGAQPDSTGPQIAVRVATSADPGAVVIRGDGFTPGGKVYIALYDQWGAALHETRWVDASDAVFGPDGSADPARGYAPGGIIEATFSDLCTATPMVQAYDAQRDAWSGLLDVDPGC